MTADVDRAPAASVARRLGGFALRALRLELRIYASIGRLIARRPAIAPGAAGFGYHAPVITILWIFIVLSAVEIPVLDLIVHRWPVVRVIVLIAGIWGLTWMFGLLAAYLMRPHTVGPEGVRVREGLETDVLLAWDDIASIARAKRVDEPKTPKITEADGTLTLSLRMQHETIVAIELERPTLVRLPGAAPKGGEQLVDEVRIWVDDVDGFMAAVRRHI